MTRAILTLRWATLADFAGSFDELEKLLPAAERARADRLRIVDARRRFVLGRTLVRRMLGDALDADPSSLVLGAAVRGKPHLVWPERPVGFNLSHSGDVVVVAVGPTEIGVDVERIRPVVRAEGLARRFFSPAEIEAVRRAEGIDRDRAFLRIWTQKEAWLKATGLGVGMPLRELETEPDAARPPRLLVVSGDRRPAAPWSLTEVEIPGAICIVAVEGRTPDLEVHRATSRDDLST